MKLMPPRIFCRMFPEFVCEIDDPTGLFLTFDDGPTPGVTEWILSTLSKYNAKATFFVLGKNVELYPDLYEKIVEAGHRIGNHTYSHQKGWGMGQGRYIEDVDFANDTLNSSLFRPPYGQITPSQYKMLSKRYRLIMWSIISRDYNPRLSQVKCFENVSKSMQGGDIIVFHDSDKSFKNMSYALPRVLKLAKERGLECKIIDL